MLTDDQKLEAKRVSLTDEDCPGSYCPPKYDTEKQVPRPGKMLTRAKCTVCDEYWALEPNEIMRRHPRERRHYGTRNQ